jgi:hypothetical protein
MEWMTRHVTAKDLASFESYLTSIGRTWFSGVDTDGMTSVCWLTDDVAHDYTDWYLSKPDSYRD